MILTLLLVLAATTLYAQKRALETINESDLKAHLEFVAGDLMQGRDFFTDIPGLEITADYLKAQSMKMGLKPGGESYFQSVAMISSVPDQDNSYFELKGEGDSVLYHDNTIFSLGGPSGNDTVHAELVFAGYGWYDDKTKYNDTEGIDIKDKIVVVMTRNPELVKEGKQTDTNVEMRKMQKALMGGAKALVIVPDPKNPDDNFVESIRKYATGGSLSLEGAKSRRTMPIRLVFGNLELANMIVRESGKTMAQLQQEIQESGQPKSFVVESCSAKLQLVKKTSKIEGKNIIAVVEGSDPILKNECVVYTAHYDHLGMQGEGEIFNGADDNGTGTVALLEIAEAFQSLKKKPRRSIVFAWVTAEEKGLIGSDYYSQNPVFPLENTLADINLDMVGRSAEKEPEEGAELEKSLAGPNGLYIVSGKQSSELIELSEKVCGELGLEPSDELSDAFLSRSDYFHFYKNGIPVLGLSTGLHEDYHKVSDELDKIDYTKMKRVAQYAFLVGEKVANQKKRIVVDKPAVE